MTEWERADRAYWIQSYGACLLGMHSAIEAASKPKGMGAFWDSSALDWMHQALKAYRHATE